MQIDQSKRLPTGHQADLHDVIRIHHARENNLKDLSLDLPKRRLTVFTGVSGSGKSSLVFDTIAAESQRLINETYPAFVQGFMPVLPRPEVDLLEGLTPAIIVDQQRLAADPRSTVGTVTDVYAMLRILFSRLGQPHVGPPSAFSFNLATVRAAGKMTVERGSGQTVAKTYTRAGGMCSRCEGRGQVNDLDLSRLIDESKSIHEGAILIPGYKPDSWWTVGIYIESGLVDPDKSIRDFTSRELKDFLYHEPKRIKVNGVNVTYEGLVPKVQKSILSKDPDAMQPHIRAWVDQAVTFTTCPDCDGTRLNDAARSSKIAGLSIADLSAMQASDLAAWLAELDAPSVAPLVQSLRETLDSFVQIGLGYLSLDRPSGTLSGGEAQRARMIRHLGSPLTDITYVFDEPTAGLHPHDIDRMHQLLLQLRDKGNTVLVVEHDPATIAIADHIVDLGPGAGTAGGEICFQGDYRGLRKSGTETGRRLADRPAIKTAFRESTGAMEIRGASLHNLKEVDVDIPLGVLTVVTGVAGSGKSSLLHGSVDGREGVVSADQSPVRGSSRSNPATYSGVLEPIRKAFAKANGVKPALFSSNSEGACPACNGTGVIQTDLTVMASVATTCEECEGRRFQSEVLEYRLGDLNIAEVLDLPISDALRFFSDGPAQTPAAVPILQRLVDVGLGYIKLGQPLSTLSGGEGQRLKLAAEMTEKGSIYILDEPTSGLHLADIGNLLHLLDRLVDSGKTVIVIEHNMAVMAHADWIIDMGPGAGHEGGTVVFTGTPAEMVTNPTTLTGKHLAGYVSN